MSVQRFMVPCEITSQGYIEIDAVDEDEAMFVAYQFLLMGHESDFEFVGTDRSIKVSLPQPMEEELEIEQ